MGLQCGMSSIFLIGQLPDMCDFGILKSVSNRAAYFRGVKRLLLEDMLRQSVTTKHLKWGHYAFENILRL